MDYFRMLLLSLPLTITGILLINFLPARTKSLFTFLFVLINAVITSLPAFHVLSGTSIEYTLSVLQVFGDVSLRMDPLSAFFILIINFTALTGAWYGTGYMSSYSHQKTNLSLHWSAYLVFHLSMLWVCMVQNGLMFLIVWEIMSLSSLMLVIFEHEKSKTLKAGVNYMVQMHIGVAFLTAAFLWVYFKTGSFDFRSIGIFFRTNPNTWLFLLFFAGFGIKAGFIPFHTWLPHAHPAAPSHISGVMSGVIVKLGIYGIFRMVTFLSSDYGLIGHIILITSVLTGLFGIINSAIQCNFKKLLAYCTIENIGIIGIGIGLGLTGMEKNNPVLIILGFSGALLHTLNHSLLKSLLFFSAGSVYQQTHTRNIEKLGGLIHVMPKTAIMFLTGAIAIGGLPPLNGFISEIILYKGLLEGIKLNDFYHITLFTMVFGGLAIIGGVSVLTFTKSFGIIFLGAPRKKLHVTPSEVTDSMLIPQYFIVLVMISIAVFPVFYFKPVFAVVQTSFQQTGLSEEPTIIPFLKNLSLIGKYSLFFSVLILFVYMLRRYFTRRSNETISSTWGCGWVAPGTSMQYTGKSFSKPLGKITGIFTPEKKKYRGLSAGEVFPDPRKYSSGSFDFFESNFIEKINNRLLYFMNLFQFVQNGSMQMYILYGLFFILLIFLISIFNFIG